jgi:hypothetical protein
MRDANGYAKKPGKVTKVAGLSFDIGEEFDPTLSPEERHSEMMTVRDNIRSNPNLRRIFQRNIPAARRNLGIKGV